MMKWKLIITKINKLMKGIKWNFTLVIFLEILGVDDEKWVGKCNESTEK